jgi:ribosomal protein L32
MDSTSQENIIKFVKLARRLEMDGLYNAAKLLWAATFSTEIRHSSQGELSTDSPAVEADLEAAIQAMQATPGQAALAKALRNVKRGIREKRTISQAEIPQVSVCRTCGEAYLGKAPNTCTECGAYSLTFREFLPIWYLEPLPPAQALKALASGINEISALVEGLGDEQMEYYPEPGEWNFREALQHLLISQKLLTGRVEKMLAEQNPSLAGVAAWMLDDGEAKPGSQIFQNLNASRLELLNRLQTLPVESWWRTGEHEEFGQVTIQQQVSYFAKHELAHLLQVRQIRAAVLSREG